MNGRIGWWYLPGAGLGWALALWVLVWILPFNWSFVDSLPWGLLVLMVLPGVAGGLLGLAAGASMAMVRRRRPVWVAMPGWPGRVALAVGALALVLILSSRFAPPRELHTKLMVYGVDGATWAVIDAVQPLEMLPALEQLRHDGASGVLRSIEPMLSPIVWTTIASGVGLEEHGIAGFHVRNTDARAARFWDVFEDRGMVVGTYKWLVTYPPREIAGFMVPGWLATGPEVVPEDLSYARAFEQSRRARYRSEAGEAPSQPAVESVGPVRYVALGVRRGLRLSTLVEMVRFTIEGRLRPRRADEAMVRLQTLRALIDRDLFFGLLDRYDPDVATFTYYPTDAVAHRMWRYYEPDKFGGVSASGRKLWDAIPATYRQADDLLAELRRRLPDDVLLAVLSDHGMCAAGSEGGVAVYGIRAGEVAGTLEAAGADVDVSQVGMKVTVAVGDGGGLPAEDVREMLGRFVLGDRPLFRIEDVAAGVFGLTLAPEGDVRSRSEESVTLPDGSGVPLESFLRTRADYSGIHHEEGVILLAGPGVAAGMAIEDADLYDVAPTLLAALGVPPSGEMEGRVLADAFLVDIGRPPGRESYDDLLGDHRFLTTGADEAGAAALEERLRALGYVDTPREEDQGDQAGGGER